MIEVEIASKSWGDAGHLYVLLQHCEFSFLLGQITMLFHGIGVDPFIDPAPNGPENRRVPR